MSTGRRPSEAGLPDNHTNEALRPERAGLRGATLSEERMRRAARPSLFHMIDGRLQFRLGKVETKLVREHIAKPLDAGYRTAFYLA